MSEMVEKVARAIYESCPLFMAKGFDIDRMEKLPWDELDDDMKSEAFDAARDALNAMREPNAEMMEAFYRTMSDGDSPDDFTPTITKALNALIDTALKEGNGDG